MANNIQVSIAIPNEKDLEIMNDAMEKCKYFGVSYEVVVTSAHRSPQEMMDYARGLRSRGVSVVIAALPTSLFKPCNIATCGL